MYKIIVYIPEGYLEAVKAAMFAAGAGQYPDDHYDQCCWQALGMGQFRPLNRANPAIGEVGKVSEVREWRVEMVAPKAKVREVIRACQQAHPYEVVAYDIYPLVDIATL